MERMINRCFRLELHQTTIKQEFLAGLTTFLTCAYILSVNPMILSQTGMSFGPLMTATALSSMIATLYMGLFANLPIALAPGMGLNAFFAYSVVMAMGHSWQYALTAVFIEGIIFMLLTAINVREAIVDALPSCVKKSISAGIGLFITFIGLVNGGLVETGMKIDQEGQLSGVLLKLGDLTKQSHLLTLIGMALIAFLLVKNIKGGPLIGILLTTIIGIPLGITQIKEGQEFFSLPPSIAPIFIQFEWKNIMTLDMLYIVVTFLFVDMFDTIGVFLGVCEKANLADEKGKIPKIKQALMADALGTTVGAMVGTSTVTSYVESTAGIAQGGRTGLTAVVVAFFFGISLFLTPLFTLIPKEATAPVLILVGLFMFSSIGDIDFKNMDQAIPAFLTIIIMPLTYSIADGIAFGVLSYLLIKIMTLKFKEIPLPLYFIGLFFILKFFT